MVRILKCMRNEMRDNAYLEANNIPSFLIECLLWNVPDRYFKNSLYINNLSEILDYLVLKTVDANNCQEWKEVSKLKDLFKSDQAWTQEQVYNFVLATKRYFDLR